MKIEITENDLFCYVFSSSLLDRNKYDFIERNIDTFNEELLYLSSIKRIQFDDLDDDLLTKTLNNTNATNNKVLYPQVIREKKEPIGLRLAAASVLNEVKPNSITFMDRDSKYLIRIVKTELQSILYFFTEDKSKTEYIIELSPSNIVYTLKDISRPIIIQEEDVIDSITVS